MKRLLCLPILFLLSCSGNTPASPEPKEKEEKAVYPSETISEAESKENARLFYAAYREAQKLPVNNTIILGYEVGMKEADCDALTLQLVEEGKLKKSGNEAFKGEYLFDFGDGTTTPVDIHASTTGAFRNFPQIVFGTPESEATMEEIVALRNRFVEWAIRTYGKEFFVTINHSYPDGKSASLGTNNYTWFVGSYQLDIVIGMKRVALTYSLTK